VAGANDSLIDSVIHSKRTPTGGEMQRLKDGFFDPNWELKADCSWPTIIVNTVKNYYFICALYLCF